MGETIYSKAQKLVKKMKSENIVHIGLMNLRKRVIMSIGSDERTIAKYLNVMLETGLIKDIGNSHFTLL